MKGKWREMSSEVGDDMLEEFVVEGRWDEIGQKIRRRYRGIADRVRLYAPFDGKTEWRTLVKGFKA